MIDPGLPAADWKVSLPLRWETSIGWVKPFALEKVAAESNRIAGRRIVIDFSKTLAGTTETISQWISVVPAPKDLKAEVQDKTVTFKGTFELGTHYRVAVKSGLEAQQPFKLDQAQTRDVVFKEIAPRLYFEDFATHQHLVGTRRFRLLSVNVPRIHVTARLFTGDTTPVALKAYDHYDEQSETMPPDETYNRIDVDKLPGKVIWERDLTTAAGVDKQQTLSLSWDEILGEQKTGAVLLTAESIDPVTETRKRVGTQAVIQLTDLGAVDGPQLLGVETAPPASVGQTQARRGVPLRTLLYVEDNPANLKLVEQLIARRPTMRLLSALDGSMGIQLRLPIPPLERHYE